MISMAVLTPFFDVVAGVAILAGRSSLLDTGIFKTANNNFTVRQLLALGFIGYGGLNLWKMERAECMESLENGKSNGLTQDKLKKTLDAESFAAEDKCDCGADLQYMSGDLLDDGNFLEGWLCQNPDCGEWYNAEESFGAEDWRTRLNVCDSCGFSDYDDEVVWRIDGMCRNCKSMSGAESFEAAQYIEMDCDPHHKWKLNDTPYIDYGDGSSGYIELSVRCQNCGEERFGSYSIDGNEPCALNLSKKGVKPRYYRWGAESFALETVRVEGADPTMFYTILTAHENICHPDGEECCDECLLLNGFDISEEIGREFTN